MKVSNREKLSDFFVTIILVSLMAVVIYYLPSGLFNISWQSIFTRSSIGNTLAFTVAFLVIFIYCSAYFVSKRIQKKRANVFFIAYIASLSVISGCSFTLMTYTLNNIITLNLEISIYVAVLFAGSLFLYSYIVKVVRKEITTITNEYVYYKRKKMLDTLAKCDYESYEQIGVENIYTCINNDTENISNIIGIAISGITSLVVMVCCCVYMAVSNIRLFSIALVTIIVVFLVIVGISFLSQKKWDKVRVNQEVFYKYFDGLLKGFTSLILKKKKMDEYMVDINNENTEYTKARVEADAFFSYVAFATEALIFMFLGFIVLGLPLLSNVVTISDVSEFFVIFLMLKGHFDVVVNSMPQIPKINASRKRVNEFISKLSYEAEKNSNIIKHPVLDKKFEDISYKGIEYSYKNKVDKAFKIGPMDIDFKRGEITFIIGGNGSGKSTLGKVITGLYKPDKGDVLFNSINVNQQRIGEIFSTIFYDHHLFKKLYGVDKDYDKSKADNVIRQIRLLDKIKIDDREINDIDLSSGQKKRVALLISYLEDNDIYFFDEWAAEQDPEFKYYFYTELLPQLKEEGKCVIAITHDDRFFNFADRIIKLEDGEIVNVEEIACRI